MTEILQRTLPPDPLQAYDPTPQHRVSLAPVSVPCDRAGFDQERGARTHDETFVEGKPHAMTTWLANPVLQGLAAVAALMAFIFGDSLLVRIGIAGLTGTTLLWLNRRHILSSLRAPRFWSGVLIGVVVVLSTNLALRGSAAFWSTEAPTRADVVSIETLPHRLFAFDGSEEGKTGRGVLRVVRNHDLDLDYHLLYEVPADDSYAGIAFTFPDIENMTRFRALRVVIAYDPPGGACTLYLKEKPDDISIPAHQWPSEGVSLALDATYRDDVDVDIRGSVKSVTFPLRTHFKINQERTIEVGLSAYPPSASNGACRLLSLDFLP